jgi:glucose/mannose-6-phosphate isomerase
MAKNPRDLIMMNLDDLSCIQQNDPSNMLAEIDALPDQLAKAWQLGQSQPYEGLEPSQGFSRIVITGMGGSAIGADLLAAYVQSVCKVPVVVHRDYGLPAFTTGAETLVIASSHSGNTEETLDAFDVGLGAGCRMIAICTGGKLAQKAAAAGMPVWLFEHHGMPRAAVGYSFGLLLALFSRLGLVASPETLSVEVKSAIGVMQEQQKISYVDVPIARNLAKRMAGQLVGQWVNVIGSGLLAPVARRWKGQINELAKAGAGFDAIPEVDHNSLAGLHNPVETLSRTCTLFLRAPSDHPRNRKRIELTHQVYMLEGLRTDWYDAQGASPLAHIWSALHFGDYLAFYLAMAYGVDPTPIAALVDFKQKMISE